MNFIYKGMMTLLISSLLMACQSTTIPQWYTLPQANNPDYISAVGEGRNLHQAKTSALSNINAALWTQVNASFSINDNHRSINDKSYSNADVRNAINTKTADIGFSGVEYTHIAHNDAFFYAQAQIKTSSVISQLQSDLNNLNQKSKAQLEQLKYQDPLQWWLTHKNASSNKEYASVRIAILASLDPKTQYTAPYLDKLISRNAQVKSGIVIHIKASKEDEKIAQMLSDKLTAEGINTVLKKQEKRGQTLQIESQLRQIRIGDAYISTKITHLQLLNKQNNIIGSSEIISTGNSLSNYNISKEGTERHFSALVDERGIWPALGFEL